MPPTGPDPFSSPERYYQDMSPQLAARLRQMWSARGHDLDRIWSACISALPGIQPLPQTDASESRAFDSKAHDRLCCLDQALIWVCAINCAARHGAERTDLALVAEQILALEMMSARLIETVTALRMLALSGLSAPALQLARSVSEDVDMTLALLLRRRLARQFVACATPEDANSFWRRHIAGGRAFRMVAEKLYSIGLDHSDQSEYGQWRREVLTLLGTAVHSSPLGRRKPRPALAWPADPVARDCLDFVTQRLHELCAWAHLLDVGLASDLTLIAETGLSSASAHDARLLAFAANSTGIVLDQMRWTAALADSEASRAAPRPVIAGSVDLP